MFGKFKKFFRKYGYVFLGTYFGVYLSTLSSIYTALEFDVFSAETFGYDAKTLIKKVVSLFCARNLLQLIFDVRDATQ